MSETINFLLLSLLEKPRTMKELVNLFSTTPYTIRQQLKWFIDGKFITYNEETEVFTLTKKAKPYLRHWGVTSNITIKKYKKFIREKKRIQRLMLQGMEAYYEKLIQKVQRAKGTVKGLLQISLVLEQVKTKLEDIMEDKIPDEETMSPEEVEKFEEVHTALESAIDQLASTIESIEEAMEAIA